MTEQSAATYLSFWNEVGKNFPSLKGAPSTGYYLACEQKLFEDFIPSLEGKKILKTDLWDEAKNTEILRWTADHGARPFGIDIAFDVVEEARTVLNGHRPGFIGGDVRKLPFRDGSFDLVYSMGTIEHFSEYREAAADIQRVLKPGGMAIIGVPNKLDPFLRPLMVDLMNRFKLYDYGVEKSFTPNELRGLLQDAGFDVGPISGILFIPGWLRMADLLIHTRLPALSMLIAPFVKPFAWLYEHVPQVRRHGYLLAAVVTKPASAAR